jgi:NAD+ synthase
MRPLQGRIRSALGVLPTIDPQQEIDRRRQFLEDYLDRAGATALVLGISGGQDSCLAGRLCQLAAESRRRHGESATFIAVRLPYGVQIDEEDAQLSLSFVRPDRTITFDIKRGVDGVATEFADALGMALPDFGKGNTKARIRMVSQYAIAAETGGLVVGTDHAAEAVTGFFTKFGDGGADVLPLAGLTKRQGRSLLNHLGAPPRLYEKAPTADLLDEAPGQTDEANLGLSYNHIDDYLEGHDVPDAIAEAIEKRYLATAHKRHLPASLHDSWWRDDESERE